MASKNAILILGLLLLAMVVLIPSKIATARDFPEKISSNSKAVLEISNFSNDNEVESSGGGRGVDQLPKGCHHCCPRVPRFCTVCCNKPPSDNNL
ncbi:hypothetical protein HN51_028285 [Arachis hypogaea]|nr:uncharacterized protein DS421_9g269820 [Arachis hypogaea]